MLIAEFSVCHGGNASQHVLDTYQQPNNDLMPQLSQCFIDMKVLEIEYQSEKLEITRRVIEPQMFMLNWPIWYLLAWDELRNDVRMFRIDRNVSKRIPIVRFE